MLASRFPGFALESVYTSSAFFNEILIPLNCFCQGELLEYLRSRGRAQITGEQQKGFARLETPFILNITL